jgi:hypothetical protein
MSVNLANKFCSACGNAILETAVICPKCGSPTSKYRPETGQAGKSKTTAVVLAVFLGFWSWLYTYRVNKTKFWLTMSIHLLWWVALILSAVIFAMRASSGIYIAEDYPFQVFTQIILWSGRIIAIGGWLWALLDNATKPQSFYTNFGRKS